MKTRGIDEVAAEVNEEAHSWLGKLDIENYVQGCLVRDALYSNDDDDDGTLGRPLFIGLDTTILKTKKSLLLCGGDILVASAEVQVNYRLYLAADGKLDKCGVLVKASKAERVNLEKQLPESFEFVRQVFNPPVKQNALTLV
jgi:hypothetical protein